MTDVHILCDIGRREINQNARFFRSGRLFFLFLLFGTFFLLFFFFSSLYGCRCLQVNGFLKAHGLRHVYVIDLVLDEFWLQVDVHEESGFLGRAFSDLGKLDTINDVCRLWLRCNTFHYSCGHSLTVGEAECSGLLVHVKKLHGTGTDVLPVFVLLSSDTHGISELGYGALGSTLDNAREMFVNCNHLNYVFIFIKKINSRINNQY